jgi:hypothetical protein
MGTAEVMTKTYRVVAALAAIALLGGCSSKAKNAAADVSVSQCQNGAGGKPSAQGQITNTSSKASGYAFSVAFLDAAGNKVSEGPVSVAKVDSGGSAQWNVTGLAGANGPVTCKVNKVVRTAVP